MKHFILLLFFGCCVYTKAYSNGLGAAHSMFNRRFALWPSVHNGAALLRTRRQSQGPVPQDGVPGPNEGSTGDSKLPHELPAVVLPTQSPSSSHPLPVAEATTKVVKPDTPAAKDNSTPKGNATEPTSTNTTTNATVVESEKNATIVVAADPTTKDMDPGVVKRGLIVFSGFALLAMAYFVFYRTKNKMNDPASTNSTIDTNQFRYGILQSEDRRDDKAKLMPGLLDSVESDEDEDEDLEIFDLGQKKKSLSYVNLQGTDEDIVLSPRDNTSDREDLLLDIEDANSDTLINWSMTGSKSIL